MEHEFWFTSNQLKVIEGEDEYTNPNRFGKQLAEWLSESINTQGYQSSAHADDWGWRVDCLDDPCRVWIGCGNVDDMDDEGNSVKPDLDNIVWHCFVVAEAPFFKKLFGKVDPEKHRDKVSVMLHELLTRTDHITSVTEP